MVCHLQLQGLSWPSQQHQRSQQLQALQIQAIKLQLKAQRKLCSKQEPLRTPAQILPQQMLPLQKLVASAKLLRRLIPSSILLSPATRQMLTQVHHLQTTHQPSQTPRLHQIQSQTLSRSTPPWKNQKRLAWPRALWNARVRLQTRKTPASICASISAQLQLH